ncbi:putative ribonuclease (polynucleotidyl transferase) from prophage [Candidatus Sodalis pierantonius str. SOPE]|uniref:Putative ribonuclease (Polynucleotidyl transferase) from prophage n=1 Tax=Candidatus Sodalis pierantonii str. SOPE TaxID=2342 RepID=W0HJM8_9GAMM|nr:3'-5' exonuclease [Candidatus Sodalis pierantonius]AHF74041.1 putative ribonuclease (polynucleotidyl transferase) from prophage [Candidatus Sodalis pierantonius str. SOPE]
MNHLMIDIETLGVRASAPLAAIGAVFFEPTTGQLGKAFYARVDPRSDEAAGARAEVDTALWWLCQDAQARAELIIDPRLSASDALNALLNYINASQIPAGRKHLNIWCKGGSFDVVILSAAFELHGLPIPWHFWRVRNMRTLLSLAQANDYCPPPRQTPEHYALDDARYQAQVVAEIWQRHSAPFLEHC